MSNSISPIGAITDAWAEQQALSLYSHSPFKGNAATKATEAMKDADEKFAEEQQEDAAADPDSGAENDEAPIKPVKVPTSLA